MLFKTDKMMLTGKKAALVPCLLSSAGAHVIMQSIPPRPSRESHGSVDLQYLINSTILTPEMKKFGNWSDAVCDRVYSLPCEWIDVNEDIDMKARNQPKSPPGNPEMQKLLRK